MNVVWKFIAGFAMTLVMVIFVPYVNSEYVTPFLVDKLSSFGLLATVPLGTLVNAVMYLGLFGFMMIFGGGAVMRYCGIAGVVGLVAAYAVLGDVNDAVVPLISLAAVTVITWNLSKRKEAKKKAKEEEKRREEEEKKKLKKKLF